MVQQIAATFQNGVFKPDERPALPESARVRLVFETIADDTASPRDSWDALRRIWATSTFSSAGDRLTREQLHERR